MFNDSADYRNIMYAVKDVPQFRDYGYQPGDVVTVQSASAVHDIYPWRGCAVDCEVIKEYPAYICCRVLPHRAEHDSFGVSRPYNICVNKADVICGDVRIW